MDDTQMANDIRSAAHALRDKIAAAQGAGLEVDVGVSFALWLVRGSPPGEPEYWTIKRRTL